MGSSLEATKRRPVRECDAQRIPVKLILERRFVSARVLSVLALLFHILRSLWLRRNPRLEIEHSLGQRLVSRSTKPSQIGNDAGVEGAPSQLSGATVERSAVYYVIIEEYRGLIGETTHVGLADESIAYVDRNVARLVASLLLAIGPHPHRLFSSLRQVRDCWSYVATASGLRRPGVWWRNDVSGCGSYDATDVGAERVELVESRLLCIVCSSRGLELIRKRCRWWELLFCLSVSGNHCGWRGVAF